MLDGLLVLVFALHLIAVDLAMAGPLVAMAIEWRGQSRGDAAGIALSRRLAIWSLVAAVVGVGLGLVSTTLLPGGESSQYRAAFARLPAIRWWWIAGELGFYAVVMAAYIGLASPLARSRVGRVIHRLLAVLAATNLLYHFPPLFVVISALSFRPDLWQTPFDVSLYRQLFLQSESLARVTHHWLASFAVAGCAVMLLASRARAANADAARWTRLGAKVALIATLLQLPVGGWVLLSSQRGMQEAMLGEDAWSTVLLVLSVLLALGVMHHLAAAAFGDASRRAVIRVSVMLAAVILLMVATLHRARQPALEAVPKPAVSSS